MIQRSFLVSACTHVLVSMGFLPTPVWLGTRPPVQEGTCWWKLSQEQSCWDWLAPEASVTDLAKLPQLDALWASVQGSRC